MSSAPESDVDLDQILDEIDTGKGDGAASSASTTAPRKRRKKAGKRNPTNQELLKNPSQYEGITTENSISAAINVPCIMWDHILDFVTPRVTDPDIQHTANTQRLMQRRAMYVCKLASLCTSFRRRFTMNDYWEVPYLVASGEIGHHSLSKSLAATSLSVLVNCGCQCRERNEGRCACSRICTCTGIPREPDIVLARSKPDNTKLFPLVYYYATIHKIAEQLSNVLHESASKHKTIYLNFSKKNRSSSTNAFGYIRSLDYSVYGANKRENKLSVNETVARKLHSIWSRTRCEALGMTTVKKRLEHIRKSVRNVRSNRHTIRAVSYHASSPEIFKISEKSGVRNASDTNNWLKVAKHASRLLDM